jgi:DNA repair protein RadC
LQQEHFVAVYLDSKNNIITDQTITKGIVNASLIHPREVFHGAIKSLASSVIVLHNHPSGDPTPSAEDLDITKRLVETGNVMGIPLLDHVIIAKELYWSWKENNIK